MSWMYSPNVLAQWTGSIARAIGWRVFLSLTIRSSPLKCWCSLAHHTNRHRSWSAANSVRSMGSYCVGCNCIVRLSQLHWEVRHLVVGQYTSVLLNPLNSIVRQTERRADCGWLPEYAAEISGHFIGWHDSGFKLKLSTENFRMRTFESCITAVKIILI